MLLSATALGFGLLTSNISSAAVINSTWDGDAIGNGSWNDASLWSPDGVPNNDGTDAFNVTVPSHPVNPQPNGPTLNTNDFTIDNLTVGRDAFVAGSFGNDLTVTGTTQLNPPVVSGFNGEIRAIDNIFTLGTLTNYNPATRQFGNGQLNVSAAVMATIQFHGADIVTNNGGIILSGPNARILNQDTGSSGLVNLAVNNGRLIFSNGANFTTAGDFTNNNPFQIQNFIPGTPSTTFTVSGALTNFNPATGTLSGGFFQVLESNGSAATLRFAGADIRRLENTTVQVIGANARITDLAGNDALRNLSSVTGSLTLGGTRTITPATGQLQVNGTFTIAGSSSVNVQGGYGQTGGQFSVGNGSTFATAGETFYDSTQLLLNGTSISPLTTNVSAPGTVVIRTGFVSGNGSLNAGISSIASTFSPGFSPGHIVVNGPASFDSGSTFIMELGGITPATEFDLISQTGPMSLTLGGSTLNVSFINGFQNAITGADSFAIITSANPIAGTFGNAASGSRLVTSDGLGSFLVTYGAGSATPDRVVLSGFQAVPEPGAWALALGGAGVLLLFRRRLRRGRR